MFLFKNMLLCDKDLIKVNNFSIVAIRIQSDPIILPDPDSATYFCVFITKNATFLNMYLERYSSKEKEKQFQHKRALQRTVSGSYLNI